MGSLNSILFIILSINLYQFVFHHPVASTDVLIPGDQVNSTSSLVSPGGNFTLRFSQSVHSWTYLGIWYLFDYQIVWVANRNMPILNVEDGVVLKIEDSGTLKVVNGSGTTLFNIFYNQVGSGNKTRAVLEDSGNFVVYDELNRTLWQSFDHPIDILIAGMKLGYNLTTKQNWTLTSWLSDQVPASGAFTLSLERYQNSPQLLIYRRGVLYWASGPWKDGTFRFLDSFYRSTDLPSYYLSLISDPSGMSVTFQTNEYKLRLNPDGQFDDGSVPINVGAKFCYGYPSDDGCVVSTLPNYCRGQSDSFQWKIGNWTGGPSISDDNSSINLNECMEKCWNKCNCVGFISYSNGVGCTTWVNNSKYMQFIEDPSGTEHQYVLVSQKSLKTTGSASAKSIDVLNPGDELNTTSYLVSAGGNFTLGFFTNAGFSYLGIWNSNAGQGMKVWVANRDTPILHSLGVALIIDDLGTLKVVDFDGLTWFNIFYNQVGSGNTTAVLEDSGNFIVYNTTKNQTLWQSFDNPTDTLVPGMKLGYNLTTKKNWTLTSSANDDDPASGAFTMRLEQYQNSPQLLIYRRGKLYWASGPWNTTIGTFQLMIGSHSHFPYDLISDPSGMYLIVKTIGSVSSTMQLSPNGQFFDSSSLFLSSPDFCYGYQSDDGCVISAWPKCRDQIGNYQWESGSWIVNSSNHYDDSSISLGDCMERCWNDCNCAGCMTNTDGTGCITWTEDNIFGLDDSGSTGQKHILVTPKSPSKKRIWRWILVSIAILLTSALTIYLCCVKIRMCLLKAKEKRRRDDYLHQLTGSDSFNYGDELEKGVKDAPDVKIFSLKAILTATENFSNENKLGQGGYGPVYKGKLFDGREIAVKRLSKTSGQGMQEFKSELILISKLQHTNLVRLYGCCIHQEEKMLIYEFMPNKSLDFFLFAKGKEKKIDWQMRFNIIEGVAQGLLYLHKYSRMRVIHRDLKVSNVLLDGNMNPKIADFGMARIFKQDVTKAFTNRVVGTRGYMAPEYAMEGTFSIKSDVFSFGVLILEIVSGKKNSSFYNLDRPLNLVGYAWELWKDKQH